MAGLVPAIRALLLCYCKKGVDARDIRAFTPVFDGLMRRHDDGESDSVTAERAPVRER